MMIGKHLVFALRNLKKNILYTLFVVGGLAIGISTFLSTIQWSAWHLTFDRKFPDKERIYRLTFEEINEGFYRHTARIIHGGAITKITFTDMLSGIEKVGRLAPFRKAAFRIGENSYYDQFSYGCDPAFLEIFQPTVLSGKRTDLLVEPQTAVLTESTARRFFGDTNPIGESFELIHQFEVSPVTYTVVAVIEDFPRNSHFKISALTSFTDPIAYTGTAWTYVKLEAGTDPLKTQEDIKLFIDTNEDLDYSEGIFPHLQPVSDIHLHSHKAREIQANVRFRTVLVVLITGILVFVLAWFNFTLLAFSQNQLRIQRLVVQWQMGAGRSNFFRQFMADNLIAGGMAYLAGIGLTLLLIPIIEQQGGSYMYEDPLIAILSMLLLLLLILGSSLLTSVYSTSRLYRYLQYRHLSSRTASPPDQTGKNRFIRAVIALEFIITFVLLSNLFMINRQTRFAMSEQLGAAQEEAIHLHSLHRTIIDEFELFKEKMLESPHVANVTASMEEPTGQTMDANTFRIDGVDEGDKQLFLFTVDQEFLRFYNIEILHGSDFPAHYNPRDSVEYFVLNETAARMLTENPGELVGRELALDFNYPGYFWPGPITGIVEDFHLSGLDYQVLPMVIMPKHPWLFCFSVLPAGHPKETLEHLQTVWKELFPSFPLEYHFGSSLIEELYEAELDQIWLLFAFSILSIFISGMGLFALSGLFMQRRVKAAALKKIQGAGMRELILPELLYYLWLALLSSAVSIPASLFLIERWLRNFKYRTDIPLWIFPLCVGVLILFSWIAVAYHAVRLAKTNPIEFIREQ
jgi:putative ABC transport system permease protein